MNLPGGSGSSGGICCPAICSSLVSTRPGKNPSPEGAGWKRSLERASFLCGWSLPFLNIFLYFSVCTAHLFPLFLRCRLRRLPQSGYRSGFTAILPEISLFLQWYTLFLKSVKAGSFLRLRLSADVCFFTMSDWHGCFRKNTCHKFQNRSMRRGSTNLEDVKTYILWNNSNSERSLQRRTLSHKSHY